METKSKSFISNKYKNESKSKNKHNKKEKKKSKSELASEEIDLLNKRILNELPQLKNIQPQQKSSRE